MRPATRWGVASLLALVATAPAHAVTSAEAATGPAGRVSPTTADRSPMPGQWWYDAMSLDEVHAQATGRGVKVAVIDGYLDPEVPDLRGARISKGDGCTGGGQSPYLSGDLADHGTAMTTAIVGQGTGNAAGGKGVVGVAPDAQVRFYSFDTDPEQELVECDAVLIARQIDKAVAWGADVISMSIGAGGGMEKAIQRAWDTGAVVVAASGEVAEGKRRATSTFTFPAATPGVVAVAAASSDGTVWPRNPLSQPVVDQYLTVTAPGVEVPVGGFPPGQGWLSGGVRTGTSPATAITAGAFAVLKSRWPEATGNQLIQSVIHHTNGNETGEPSFSRSAGYGRISLSTALDVDPTGYPDENPLLLTPRKAIAAYPADSYGAETDGAAADGGSGASGDAAAEGDEASAEGEVAPAGDGEAVAPADGGGGLPAWAVALGVLALVAAGAAALLARRRSARADRSRTSTPADGDDHAATTTYDHTAPRGS